MRVGIVQMTSTEDVAKNLCTARAFVREAAEQGAEWVALPENFAYLRREGMPIPCAQPLNGEIISSMCELAQELSIWLLAGSFPEAIAEDERVFNTSVMIGPDGAVRGTYRKIHLFDVDLRSAGGAAYTESATIAPGMEPEVIETPFGPVGLSICYDLRFPELYRCLVERGARWLTVPSAFTPKTGEAHWETLLRARAIENQAFVVAPAQVGTHNPKRRSYGHSILIDPWGRVLAEAPDEPCVLVAECDLTEQEHVRNALPCLQHRRIGIAQAAATARR